MAHSGALGGFRGIPDSDRHVNDDRTELGSFGSPAVSRVSAFHKQPPPGPVVRGIPAASACEDRLRSWPGHVQREMTFLFEQAELQKAKRNK